MNQQEKAEWEIKFFYSYERTTGMTLDEYIKLYRRIGNE